MRDATNAHDARRVASLFADDYPSAQPLHPGRAFGGRAQVFENWPSVFRGVPDFTSERGEASVNGATEWGEWEWRGHHTDGASCAMRGITVLVRDDLVAEARLYMEPVDLGGEDIDAAVQELNKPPPGSAH